MKSLTLQQKKWTLATSLLVVLGFNISFNPKSEYGFSGIDFASTEAVTDSFDVGKATIDVVYVQGHDDKVIAIARTESEASCEGYCGSHVLKNVSWSKNKNNIRALGLALEESVQKKHSKSSVEEEAPEKLTKEEIEEEKKEKRIASFQKRLDAIEKKCASDVDDFKGASCMTKEVIDIMKDMQKEKLETDIVADYINGTLEEKMSDWISQYHEFAISNVKSQLGMESDELVDMEAADARTLRRDVLGSLKRLLSALPRSMSGERRSLLAMQSDIVANQAREIAALKASAEANSGTEQGVLDLYRAQQQMNALRALDGDLQLTSRNALGEAVGQRFLSSADANTLLRDLQSRNNCFILGAFDSQIALDSSCLSTGNSLLRLQRESLIDGLPSSFPSLPTNVIIGAPAVGNVQQFAPAGQTNQYLNLRTQGRM